MPLQAPEAVLSPLAVPRPAPPSVPGSLRRRQGCLAQRLLTIGRILRFGMCRRGIALGRTSDAGEVTLCLGFSFLYQPGLPVAVFPK